jgi:hypothetical protein
MLPAQLACMIWVSELYPAPVGPLFSGNPDVGGRAQTCWQELAVIEEGRAIPVDEARLLGVPGWYARNIAGFRFPLEPASVDGFGSVGRRGTGTSPYREALTSSGPWPSTESATA